MQPEQFKKLQMDYIESERVRYNALLNGANHKDLNLHDLSKQQINARLEQLDVMEKDLNV